MAMKKKSVNDRIWINPIGGLGDTLMLSGVLRLVIEERPGERFNLVRRTRYLSLLQGHPALSRIGNPPKGAKILGTDYWGREELGGGNRRAFQVLARVFGLRTPVEERLFLPGSGESDPLLEGIIPWKGENIVIAPFSDAPRKEMSMENWQELVRRLSRPDRLILQMGTDRRRHIRNAYSLLDITTPRQAISIVGKCSLVITSDNFAMHAAHLVGVPAVVLWGPTRAEIYGYPRQMHLRSDSPCEKEHECLGPKFPHNYHTQCPLGESHCMNRIDFEEICGVVENYRVWM